MPELILQRSFSHARLIRIDLPGMHVKNIGVLFLKDIPDARVKKYRRQQPEISPAAQWDDPAAQAGIADGQF